MELNLKSNHMMITTNENNIESSVYLIEKENIIWTIIIDNKWVKGNK